MKKVISILVAIIIFSSIQGLTESLPQELINAINKTGQAKITALLDYIKKNQNSNYPGMGAAHYHLTITYFKTKNYAQTLLWSQKSLKLGSLSEGEEGRLLLIIAKSYGAKNTRIYNIDKALQYAQKTIKFSKSRKLNALLKEAQQLKNQLIK